MTRLALLLGSALFVLAFVSVVYRVARADDCDCSCDGPVFGVWDTDWRADNFGSPVVDAYWCPVDLSDATDCIDGHDWYKFATFYTNLNYCDSNLPYRVVEDPGFYIGYKFVVRESTMFDNLSQEWEVPPVEWMGSVRYRGFLGPVSPPSILIEFEDGSVPWILGCDLRPEVCSAVNLNRDDWALDLLTPIGASYVDSRVPDNRFWVLGR